MTDQEEQAASTNAVSAVRWSAMSKYGAQAMQFGVSLLLARLLAPEYFGLLGMATVVTGFANTLKNLGFNAAIVQRDDIDHQLLSTLFWVNLAFCATIGVALMAVSPVVSWIYRDDRVAPIVAVLAIGVIINAFSTVPSALLQRRLEFKKLATRELGGVIASGATGITCALMGLGVWSLVCATLALAISDVVLLNIAEPFWPERTIDSKRLKECLSFGLNITGFNVFNYFARNADNLIIGICLGPAALGFYSLGYRFMLLPRDTITHVVSRVLFPKLSRLQNDDAQLADVFLRTVGCVALITMPAMIGLALVADPFVRLFLGDKWLPAIPVIAILAPIGAIQSISSLVGQIYLAKGRSDWMFRWGVCVSIICVSSFILGTFWGLSGVAYCYLAANLVLLGPTLRIPFSLVKPLTINRFVRSLWPYLAGTMIMTVSVAAAMQLTSTITTGSAWILCVGIVVGIMSYAMAMLTLRPAAVSDVLKLAGIRQVGHQANQQAKPKTA